VFALFCLGDRAYGDLFCAAGRKLAVRLLQLGAKLQCPVGYGDDNTPNGGVFADLDAWLHGDLLPSLPEGPVDPLSSSSGPIEEDLSRHYQVSMSSTTEMNRCDQYLPHEEWRQPEYSEFYRAYMQFMQPRTAYEYRRSSKVLWGCERIAADEKIDQSSALSLLEFRAARNDRLTPLDWTQNTRHVRLELVVDADDEKQAMNVRQELSGAGTLLYRAGDVAAILPVNSFDSVERFLIALPGSVRAVVDQPMSVAIRSRTTDETSTALSSLLSSCSPWPERCTLRGWLTLCADIHALPEREDLRSLSLYCDTKVHPFGRDQQAKLVAMSETSESALYVDYVLREKRAWADVLYDFDSLRSPHSSLTVEALLALLSPIRPREFSIASSPTLEANRIMSASRGDNAAGAKLSCFGLELCVAKVEGRTPLGRSYHGSCSAYLAALNVGSIVRLWIRPGTFHGLPLELEVDVSTKRHCSPVLCIGAGTGIAPLRGLLHEREAVRDAKWAPNNVLAADLHDEATLQECDDVLVFGCRKESCDFYYKSDWNSLSEQGRLHLLTAFSRDQWHKIYVQQVLRKANEATRLLARHLIDRGGAIYIAGGPKMARAIKDEILEALARELGGDEKQARLFLARLQRVGLYSVEAWT
jgi:sulfite reductase alpha subunit-like flavoprotein